MFSSFTCSAATCSSVAIHQQEWRSRFSLFPRLPLPPSPLLCRLLSKPHTNSVPRGRIIACLSEPSSEGQDEQRSTVSTALEESMPIKDLITIAACAVGLLTGIGVVLFNDAVHYLRDLFWDGIPSRGASWLREEPIADVWPRVILVPLCGGLIVSILNKVRNSLEVSSEATVASTVRGALRPFLKTIAASVTLGTGNSLGPEGPSVEIGSSVAKGISHVFEWSGGKRLSLVAAGSAAGISSGFNAAVAGCFFAVESVLWPSSTDSFLSLTNSTSMVILSSVIASVISEVGLGSAPAFMVPEYDFRSPKLPLYLLLGILCGLVSLTLSGCTSFALEMVENFHKITRIPKTIYPAFGGMVVGLIALAYPEVLYWGFENVDILLESRPFVNGLPADVLFQLVGVKIVATSLSRASGLVGGYYAPSLFIGAATGMAYGKFMSSALSGPNPLFHLSLLEVASPQAYGLVGMAATLAGVCQVPLTSVLLLFELTQDYRIVLPLLGAVGVSSWIVSSQNKKKDVGNRLSTSGVKEASVNQYKKSIYHGQGLEASTGTSGVTDLCQIESSLCVYDSVGEINRLVEKLTVLQAMRTRYVTVLMSSSLVEAVSLMLVEKQPCAIITDANGFLVELLSLEDIQNFSKVAKKRGTQTEFEKILVSHVCHLVGKKYQVRAVTPDTTLATAESIMNSQGVNQLAVVSGHVDGQKKGHLVGLLDRESISVACRAAATKESLGLSSENL